MPVIADYLTHLNDVLSGAECTNSKGEMLSLEEGAIWGRDVTASMKESSRKIMFVGNGGSMGIASHLAIDFTKNGGVPALAFSDPAALTCVSNDLGYDQVFAKQVEVLGQPDDLLVAISSSGQSQNILNAIEAARRAKCKILTFSGFEADNPLRGKGDVNFYVPSSKYGFVEISHMALIHAILDLMMGWRAGS